LYVTIFKKVFNSDFSEVSERVKADIDAVKLEETTTKVLGQTAVILDKLSNTPVGRRAVVREARRLVAQFRSVESKMRQLGDRATAEAAKALAMALLGRWLVPEIPFEPAFLLEGARVLPMVATAGLRVELEAR
jgi:hypothetical protein